MTKLLHSFIQTLM